MAEEIGEEAEVVKKTLSFLEANKKLERTEHGFILPEALERVGSEGTSAERMRNMRQRQVSQSDGEVSQCDADVTECDADGAQCDVDIDKDIDIDQEKDKSKIKSIYCAELSETPQRQQPPKTDKKPETIEVEPVPSGYKIILLDKSFYEIPLEKLNFWKESYPAVDVEQEFRSMAAWADANPTKRKTRRGIEKFINGWLIRSQKEQLSSSEKGTDKNGTETIQNPEEDPERVSDVREVWERLRREGRV